MSTASATMILAMGCVEAPQDAGERDQVETIEGAAISDDLAYHFRHEIEAELATRRTRHASGHVSEDLVQIVEAAHVRAADSEIDPGHCKEEDPTPTVLAKWSDSGPRHLLRDNGGLKLNVLDNVEYLSRVYQITWTLRHPDGQTEHGQIPLAHRVESVGDWREFEMPLDRLPDLQPGWSELEVGFNWRVRDGRGVQSIELPVLLLNPRPNGRVLAQGSEWSRRYLGRPAETWERAGVRTARLRESQP